MAPLAAFDWVVESCALGEASRAGLCQSEQQKHGALRSAGAHRTTLIPRIRWESSLVF